MAHKRSWNYGKLPRTVRRLPAIVFGAVLGWMFADLVLLRGEDPPQKKEQAAAKAEPKKVKPSAVFSKFPDWVGCVAAAPDNRTAAAGSYEVIKLLDIVDRKEVASIPWKSGMVQAVAYSPDGRFLAAGAYQDAAVWNPLDQQKVRSFAGHRGQVTSVAFSPDGSLLATACEDEVVRVFDVASGEQKAELVGHMQPVRSVVFYADGQRLASVSGDLDRPSKKGSVKVWNLAGGKELLSIEPHQKSATSVAASPDGKHVATAGLDEVVVVFAADDLKPVQAYDEHSRAVNSVVFLPDGKHLASGAGGRNAGLNDAHVWDRKNRTIAVLEGHEKPVVHLAATPDGKRIITASHDKTVRVWDVSSVLGEAKPAAVAAAPVPDAEKKAEEPATKELKAGIIGLDTSHAIAFTKLLNAESPRPELAGCRVVAAYPKGSPDIESSVTRVPAYTEEMRKLGVEIVDSIESLLEKVDVVFLETNDGRPHFEQLLPCLKAGKPTFIDKPIAGSLADAVAIFEASRHYKTPVFSSSSLRYGVGTQAVRNGKIGEVLGCDTYSPCELEKTHPDLFWYGIHGVESLFTVMKTGCEWVTRANANDFDVVTGLWKGGRVGTFRGLRHKGATYGGMAFGTEGIHPVGGYDGYDPLVVDALKFFRSSVSPVSEEETLEIYAFMEAADESKRQGGAPVKLETVMAKAREEAKAKIESFNRDP